MRRIGPVCIVTPVYQSEITPPEHRGWQLCCQLTSMIGGIVLTYWVNYAFYFYDGPVQWRFPLLFQAVFAVYVIAVTMFMPETPRWLIRHDSTPERGIEVLAKLRGLPRDHPVVVREAKEIIEAIEIERGEEGSWRDLFKDHGISAGKRVWLGIDIQFMQQTTGMSSLPRSHLRKCTTMPPGINIVTYYAPTLFEVSLGMSQERALFFGCWVQVWYMIASFVTVSSVFTPHVNGPSYLSVTVVYHRPCRPTEAMDQHGPRANGRSCPRGSLRCGKQHKLEYCRSILRLPVRDMLHMGYVPIIGVGYRTANLDD